MNIAQEKIDIIRQVSLLNDENLISAIKNLISYGVKKQQETDVEVDFWNTLTEQQKERVNQSIESIDAGSKTPHAEVMSAFRKQHQFQQPKIS